ncbi:23S rRNA (guanosine(2251)-2'-O)-methyltransferase RlmB [Acidaminobacter sp.]|uniref:23S rRNA (guanosine(2251)-2'-O)-methyltransferase RlmB n=1 Tax=Acidaminobacter sp. TaxID=1872102 RepID=UPI0013808B0D|nr:23S rRNA (guanosine(2251)-2'-O)-methyltransferase RlmB [Acidaminobacter sp.]MDK9712261.1 23S rRNA (guanosine(2251)-2'-O)-methyltransferase RlmB [Acidaminobacter sp.]MZQ96546.1 23S rRNA (guanosine(2251)-2'-O)-methyltransferase RlmB [Acidaminobacter sp.]
MSDIIEGRNPVIEALKAGREIDKILVAEGAAEGSVKKILAMASEKNIVIQKVARAKLDQISTSDSHQGVIAYVAAYDYSDLETVLDQVEARGEKPFVILCDEITDPHNLGSIIRTADAVGAHCVVIPKRRSVGLTAVVAKTSAGALEYVPVCRVTNLSQSIEMLKKRGLWIAAAEMEGNVAHFEADLTGSIALVIGSEGQGISRLVKSHCDFLVQIPMKGKVSSLNASVAASILMYEVFRQRYGKQT